MSNQGSNLACPAGPGEEPLEVSKVPFVTWRFSGRRNFVESRRTCNLGNGVGAVTTEPKVIAIIADAVQSANMNRPQVGGTSPNRSYMSNDDSEHTALAIMERLAAFGYEVRKRGA